jgi:hypothetical protein
VSLKEEKMKRSEIVLAQGGVTMNALKYSDGKIGYYSVRISNGEARTFPRVVDAWREVKSHLKERTDQLAALNEMRSFLDRHDL